MSNLYIPINYSDLHTVIPEGADILYSSLSKIIFYRGYGKTKWRSHVLITESGIAFFIPEKKKKITPKFIPWSEIIPKPKNVIVAAFKRDFIRIFISRMSSFKIKVIREKNESFSSFNWRYDKFGGFCRKLWREKRKELGLPIE